MIPALLIFLLFVTAITSVVVLVSRTEGATELTIADGRRMLEAGDFAAAQALFGYLALHGKSEPIRLLALTWNAHTLSQQGKLSQAAEFYANYLDSRHDALSSEARAGIRDALAKLGRALEDQTRASQTERPEPPAPRSAETSDDLDPALEDSREALSESQRARARRDVARLDTGDRVGDFVIAEKLGEGGFGEVYRAMLPVAIKFARDQTSVERLRRFAELQSSIGSDRIVKPLAMDLEANPPYVAMELVDGPNLRALIQRGALPAPTALALAEELVAALADAHAANVCHLDLKPENVLLDPSGGVKLTDFELGRLDVGALQQSLAFSTQEGNPAGTLVYMSPEQRAGKQADPRSDVFTFGVILFEMLTGTLPEPGDTPSQFVEGLPASVDALFERCFARHERRYRDAREVLLDLRAARLELPEAPALAGLLSRLSEAAIATTLAAEVAPGAAGEAAAPAAPQPSAPASENTPAAESRPEAEVRPLRPPIEELLAQRQAEAAADGKIYEGDSAPARLAEPPQSA